MSHDKRLQNARRDYATEPTQENATRILQLESQATAVAHEFEPEPELPELPEGTVILGDEFGFSSHAFLLSFGAVGTIHLAVFTAGEDYDSALEQCASWLAENAPGHLIPTGELEIERIGERWQVHGPHGETFGTKEEAYEHATIDLTYTESGYIPSWEWGVSEISHAGLVRAYAEELVSSWTAFMQPEALSPALYWEIETVEGTTYLPGDIPHSDLESLGFTVGEDLEPEDVSQEFGILYRLQAPGYSDATDWVPFSSWSELYEQIANDHWESH